MQVKLTPYSVDLEERQLYMMLRSIDGEACTATTDEQLIEQMNAEADKNHGVFIQSNFHLLLNSDVCEDYPDNLPVNKDFPFPRDEYDLADIDWAPYFGSYGVVDSIEQLLDLCKAVIADPARSFILSAFPVYKANQSEGGGWRWHKWGSYYGTHNPQCEYLYDEEGIDVVWCYHIYEVLSEAQMALNSFVEVATALSKLVTTRFPDVEDRTSMLCTNGHLHNDYGSCPICSATSVNLHYEAREYLHYVVKHKQPDMPSFYETFGVLEPDDFLPGKKLLVTSITHMAPVKEITIQGVSCNGYWLTVEDTDNIEYAVVVPDHAAEKRLYTFSK